MLKIIISENVIFLNAFYNTICLKYVYKSYDAQKNIFFLIQVIIILQDKITQSLNFCSEHFCKFTESKSCLGTPFVHANDYSL